MPGVVVGVTVHQQSQSGGGAHLEQGERTAAEICASSDHVVDRNRDQRETEDAERTAKQRDVVGRIAFHNAMLQTEIRETPAPDPPGCSQH